MITNGHCSQSPINVSCYSSRYSNHRVFNVVRKAMASRAMKKGHCQAG